MSLPYKRKRSSRRAKRPRKPSIVKRRATPPDIYVHFGHDSVWGSGVAKAHIRVRRGCYRFLVWREGNKVREFYLGRLRNPSPTPGPSSSRSTRSPAEACSGVLRRVRQ